MFLQKTKIYSHFRGNQEVEELTKLPTGGKKKTQTSAIWEKILHVSMYLMVLRLASFFKCAHCVVFTLQIPTEIFTDEMKNVAFAFGTHCWKEEEMIDEIKLAKH